MTTGPDAGEEFISEPITPERGRFGTGLMGQGLAGLPAAFTWRGRRHEIVECLDHRKITAAEGGTATGERYLRRQEFRVRLGSGDVARIYVLRQPAAPGRRGGRQRWFLYTLTRG